jgi:hypothetical protein
VLNQKDLDRAVAAIERAGGAFVLNFMIGDTKGIVDVEVNPLRARAMRSQDILHHTNHYL